MSLKLIYNYLKSQSRFNCLVRSQRNFMIIVMQSDLLQMLSLNIVFDIEAIAKGSYIRKVLFDYMIQKKFWSFVIGVFLN